MDGLISPPASAASPSPSQGAAQHIASTLPNARHHPLSPGSAKEIALINYLDRKILQISRRYGKKFTESDADHAEDDIPGYMNIDQACVDITRLVDVAWASGTPHLQTSYLLLLAGTLLSYMPAFAFSTSIFPLLAKLDAAFIALLRPNSATSASSSSRGPSMTDKVRIKSLIEETRVLAVNCAFTAGYTASVQDLSSEEDSDSGDDEFGESLQHTDASVNMSLSKIYKGTLEILGDSLVT